MAENKGILVYCEADDGKLASISSELIGLGTRLSKDLGQDLNAVLIGSDISALASEVIAYGVQKVYVVEDPFLKDYLTDSYLQALDRVIAQTLPQVVIMGQTHFGRDLAPRLAFRLKAPVVMDCIAVEVEPASRRIMMTKPVYGGNALATQVCECDLQIATIRCKSMSPSIKRSDNKGEIVRISDRIDSSSVRTRVLDRRIEPSDQIKLEDARVIIAGGRGIGGADGFKQLEALAKVLKGSVGATRPPCDNQWVPDTLQVGLTGKIVGPELYIAVALSGSSQHLSGCAGSKVIVAINKDPEANIFKYAHYGIKADWKKALPAFMDKVIQIHN